MTNKYFNRHTGKLETEKVYGEFWVKWLYKSKLVRLSLAFYAKRHSANYTVGFKEVG